MHTSSCQQSRVWQGEGGQASDAHCWLCGSPARSESWQPPTDPPHRGQAPMACRSCVQRSSVLPQSTGPLRRVVPSAVTDVLAPSHCEPSARPRQHALAATYKLADAHPSVARSACPSFFLSDATFDRPTVCSSSAVSRLSELPTANCPSPAHHPRIRWSPALRIRSTMPPARAMRRAKQHRLAFSPTAPTPARMLTPPARADLSCAPYSAHWAGPRQNRCSRPQRA